MASLYLKIRDKYGVYMPQGRTLERVCIICGSKFYRKLSAVEAKGGKFCSKGCFHKSTKGKVPWNKGKRKNNRCIDCGVLTANYYAQRCRKCDTKNKIGDKSHLWRGGISKLPYSFDFTNELKELIRKRDDYKCQLCGCPQEENDGVLHVHHIDYDKKNSNPNNLISLCHSCHSKTNHKSEKWINYFGTKYGRIAL